MLGSQYEELENSGSASTITGDGWTCPACGEYVFSGQAQHVCPPSFLDVTLSIGQCKLAFSCQPTEHAIRELEAKVEELTNLVKMILAKVDSQT